jgi:hypothetical protein
MRPSACRAEVLAKAGGEHDQDRAGIFHCGADFDRAIMDPHRTMGFTPGGPIRMPTTHDVFTNGFEG